MAVINHLRLGVLMMYPVAVLKKKKKSGAMEIDGILNELSKCVFGGLNLTYDFWTKRGSPYSRKLDNGTWIGMMSMLQRKEIDVYLGPHVADEDSFNDFLLSEAGLITEGAFLASTGQKEIYNFFSFLLIIEMPVWILTILAFLSLILSVALIETDLDGKNVLSSFKYRLSKIFWIFLAAFFNEGTPHTPNRGRGRILLMMWLFCVLVFSNCLFSQFKAMITVKHEDTLIRTGQDIVDRPQLMPYLLKNSPGDLLFKTSPIETQRNIYKMAMRSPNESLLTTMRLTSVKTYQQVKDGKAVLFLEEKVMKAMLGMICHMLKGDRRLYIVDEKLLTYQFPFTFNKNFDLHLFQTINQRMMRLKEHDIVENLLYAYYKNYDKCKLEGEKKDPTLKLTHLLQSFYLLYFGLTLSCIVCLIEVIWNRVEMRNRKHERLTWM